MTSAAAADGVAERDTGVAERDTGGADSGAADRDGGPTTSVADWLRGWSDAELIAALRRRPDLALPAPIDLGALAARAGVRTSIGRALDSLDAFTLRVLDVIASGTGPCSRDDVAQWFDPADDAQVARAIDLLSEWLLVWPSPGGLAGVGAVREVLGFYAVGLGRPAGTLFAGVSEVTLALLLRRLALPAATQPAAGKAVAAKVVAELETLLADCSGPELAILRRLAEGPPVGTLRAATSPVATPWQSGSVPPARSLLDRGLLVPIDRDTVELPREVGLALRPFPAGSVRPEPANVAVVERGASTIDGGGTTAVLETVRLMQLLLESISTDPPAQLRAGGMGVRELRRLSKNLDVAESTTALLLEMAFEAGLLASTGGPEVSYLPTTEFDNWTRGSIATRWVSLAAAWLTMTRLPSLVGERDERDRTIAALAAEAERHSAPALRRQLLRALSELPPASAPTSAEDVLLRLAWQAPRRASANEPAAIAMLTEAALIGLTGYGAITSYARALIASADTGASQALANATDLLQAALPSEVAEFLLQPDLTVVVPGPPTPHLHRELRLAADLESSGGASVYRISPTSLRRALDAGRTGSDLRHFFASTSRTAVPQALDYLITDVATQHGRLRMGTAASYLRADDEQLLTRVLAEPSLAGLGLARIAPSVVICSVGVSVALERLRAAGFAPAAESADGAIMTLATELVRLPARPHSRLARISNPGVGEQQLAEVVARLRASERLTRAINQSANRVAQQIPGVTSASILELLRTAIKESATVALGYVDDAGKPSQQTLQPISLGGGYVRGHHPDETGLRRYPLQRITSVTLLED